MIRLAKINFVFLMFVTAYSGAFASDNQGQDSQSKHIIHKEGVEVKSTTIYNGVPSRQQMERQGMSIEEIKGPDPSENGAQVSRNKPISDWSEKDYLEATSPVFHDAIRNPSVGTNRSYLPKITITPGDETSVEQRTAPISTWGVQDYLKVAPQNKHQAIKEMQKSPIIIPGETTDVEPRTKPISEFTKEEYLNISPPNLHDAINNQGGTFTVGNNRSYDDITITLSTDYWYSESSWNLYDSSAGAFYYAANQTFSSSYEEQVVSLSLQPGVYSVVAYDVYSDGGITGTVTDEDGIVLATVALEYGDASAAFDFTVAPPTSDVTIALATDYFYTESSWQLFTAAGVAVNTLQTFTTSYESQSVTLALEGDSYILYTYDSYGDGGMSGTVEDADGNVLATIIHTSAGGTSASWPFAIGLYDVTVTLNADYWYTESSWNLYGPYNDTLSSGYYYSSNVTFASAYEVQEVVFSLAVGDYSVDVFDAYADGGVSGNVVNAGGDILVEWGTSSYAAAGSFMFEVELPAAEVPDLFISEYGEGSSNTKWIELYNPTDDTLDLADYSLNQFTNGSDEASFAHTFVGSVLPGETFTITRSDADAFVVAQADTVFANGNSSVVRFNGDDAVVLIKIRDGGSDTLDIIGVVGTDPGTHWDVFQQGLDGETRNNTLTRQPWVVMGNTNWAESAGTDTSATGAGEWAIHPIDHFDNIGGHPEDPCQAITSTFTFTTGSWAGEISYYLEDANGDTLLSCFTCMGTNYTSYTYELCLDDGEYIVWGKDSFGDGWNSGGGYTITDEAGTVIASGYGPSSGTAWEAFPFSIGKGQASVAGASFGGMVLSDTETQSVVVSNVGYGLGANLVVESVTADDSAFSVSTAGLPDTLAPGETLNLEVSFSPAVDEDYTAYVFVGHSAPTADSTYTGSDSAMVSGFGVDAYFYEGFDPYSGNDLVLPMDGWTVLDNNGDADSIPQYQKTWYHDDYNTYNYAGGGQMVAYNGYNNDYYADEQMITPVIHLDDVSKLSFRTYDYGQYLGVGYSEDGVTFMDLAEVYVNGYWQQHDITLPDVDSLWLEFTYNPDSGSVSYNTYLNFDEVKVTAMPNTYMEGWVYDIDADLGVGGVEVSLNSQGMASTGENELYMDPGFEDSSFVSSYLYPDVSDWWVYPAALTNFAHMTDGDLIWVDTSAALGTNELSVHEGDHALKMWGQFSGAENYTSIYKQIGAVDAGQEMYLGAWVMSHSDGPLTGGTEFFLAINWLDAGFGFIRQDQGTKLDSNYIVHADDLDWNEWHYMDVHGVAPDSYADGTPATVAHVQLQLTFYQPEGYATGSVYVDEARASMNPGHFSKRGFDEVEGGTMSFTKKGYNTTTYSQIAVFDDVADTLSLDVGMAALNETDWSTGWELDDDHGSTDLQHGDQMFAVMDSMRLTYVDSTVYEDTTAMGVDTTWTVYDTLNYNVDPYAGNGMLVFPDSGGVYHHNTYAMWVADESFDISVYSGDGGSLSMNYRRNHHIDGDDYVYVGVMLDDSTVHWGDYNNHTGNTYGSWYYASADLSWLRELDEFDSVSTATPIIIFESDSSGFDGWGAAFDDFKISGNPWFLALPGEVHAESFGTSIPVHWEEPSASGRVSYDLYSFHLNDLDNLQQPSVQTENGEVFVSRGPRQYETRTVTATYDNSARDGDPVSYRIQRRHWDATTMQIGDWEPLSVTSTTSYWDFGVSEGDRADYRVYVRYEDGDMDTPSNIAHAHAGVPHVMLVDSFATATFDSTFGEHWELWSQSATVDWVIGDSSDAHGAGGSTFGYNNPPGHPDSAGTFAFVSDGQEDGWTILMTPFLDFQGHHSALLEFDAWARVYTNWYDPYNYRYDFAAVMVRSQSENWQMAVNVTYLHNEGWVTERADLGSLIGDKDRVQFAIVWKNDYNTSSGQNFAIDNFSVSTPVGPSNLTADATQETLTLNWEGVDGRRANMYPEPLSSEQKERAIRLAGSGQNNRSLPLDRTFNRSLTSDDEIVVTSSREMGDDLFDPFVIDMPESGDTVITGSTVGFTNDYDAVCNYSGSTAPDVVFKLVLEDSINGLIIDLCESYYDTKVYLYLEDSLALGDTTEIECNDDFCSATHGQSWTSYIEMGHQLYGGVSAGTYYIVVDGYGTVETVGSNQGDYEMHLQIMQPPPDLVYNVYKDGNLVAGQLPDSVLTFTDSDATIAGSHYWVTAGRILELSNDRPWYGPGNYVFPTADFDIEYVESDRSNELEATIDNTPPVAFALITPPDGQTLEITEENVSGGQIFAWSASSDPNGYELTYHVLWETETDTGMFEIRDDTTGTAIIVPIQVMAGIMSALAQGGTYIRDWTWTVYADDGWDIVEASNGPRTITIDVGWYLGINDEAIVPDVFALHQNYPNPFNPVTTIRYDVPEQSVVTIDIYNVLGQRVAELANGIHDPGFHTVMWNGTNMSGHPQASGMYFYHITAGDFRDVKKLLLLK